jgi:hypothetical protein
MPRRKQLSKLFSKLRNIEVFSFEDLRASMINLGS